MINRRSYLSALGRGLFWASSGSLLSGCHLVPKKPELRIDLVGPVDLNEGIPCNILIRAISAQAFRGESYAEVARLVAQTDTSVLYSGVVYTPTRRAFQRTVTVVPPRSSAIGIYVFYTTLTGNWRLLIDTPLPPKLRIRLGRTNIMSEEFQ